MVDKISEAFLSRSVLFHVKLLLFNCCQQVPIALTTPETSLTAEEEAALITNYHYAGTSANTHPYLSAMVNYAQPVKFQAFDVSEGSSLALKARTKRRN